MLLVVPTPGRWAAPLPLPTSLVTRASLQNAATVLQALGGSTNALIHLAAIAGRAGQKLDLQEVDRIGRQTPLLVDLKPVGRAFMEDFHRAGGLPSLLRQLKSQLDLSCPTAKGVPLEQLLQDWPEWVNEEIIRPLDQPVTSGEALAILYGSLAPDGAALKRAAASKTLLEHEGPALVFEGLEDLAARIDDPQLPVTPEHILVLRGAGPVGGPGMPEAGSIPIPARLARSGVRDMVRISDARMSGTAYGTVILHVSPEAAVGGPLSLVRDGDRIRLDVPRRRLDLLVEDEELARRRASPPPFQPPSRGYARLFAEPVLQAHLGCDFDFLAGEPTS